VKWVQIAQPLPSDGAVRPHGDSAPAPEKWKGLPEDWLSVELEVVFAAPSIRFTRGVVILDYLTDDPRFVFSFFLPFIHSFCNSSFLGML